MLQIIVGAVAESPQQYRSPAPSELSNVDGLRKNYKSFAATFFFSSFPLQQYPPSNMSSPSPPTHRITHHSTPLRRFRLFHPTIVHLHPTTPGTKAETSTDGDLAREKSIVWSSRKARKGRYAPRPHHIHDPHAAHRLAACTIPSSTSSSSPHISPAGNAKLSSSDTKSLLGTAIIRLQTVESEFKPHLDADVSFWIAVFFTFGSVVWVVNGPSLSQVLTSPSKI